MVAAGKRSWFDVIIEASVSIAQYCIRFAGCVMTVPSGEVRAQMDPVSSSDLSSE